MQLFFRLLSYSKPYSNFVAPYIIFYFLAVILGVLNFSLLIPLFDVLFGKTAIPEINVEPTYELSPNYLKDLFYYYFYLKLKTVGAYETLWFVCTIIVASVALTNIFRFLAVMTVNRVRARLIEHLRIDLFVKFLNLDLSFFTNEKKGELMSRITNDITQVEQAIAHGLMAIFKGPITTIIYFSALFVISTKLTLFTLIYIPLSGGIIALITKKLRSQSRVGQNLLAEVLVSIEETFSGIKIIKAFNAASYVLDKFKKINTEYTKVLVGLGNRSDAASPISESMGAIVISGILIYGGSLVLSDSPDLNGSAFIAYIVIFSQILPAIKEIANSTTQLQRALVAGERIFQVIDEPSNIKNITSPVNFAEFKNEISFQGISFGYTEEKMVLQNISFEVTKGNIVALVGASGSGKSTIADLMMRFYDINKGEILIDGINIKNYDIASLRRQMAVVTQESVLFNDSIFNNIAFGMTDAKEEDVIAAAKIANAHQFILETENGYQTNIGDRGVKLSGGQRQRLSIARAIMRNPSILILDEATSALDSESEKLVQDALYNLMKNRTSLVIAHRLSTVKNADKIIVLDKGIIVEVGTHDELIKLPNGFYKKLSDLQHMNV